MKEFSYLDIMKIGFKPMKENKYVYQLLVVDSQNNQSGITIDFRDITHLANDDSYNFTIITRDVIVDVFYNVNSKVNKKSFYNKLLTKYNDLTINDKGDERLLLTEDITTEIGKRL